MFNFKTTGLGLDQDLSKKFNMSREEKMREAGEKIPYLFSVVEISGRKIRRVEYDANSLAVCTATNKFTWLYGKSGLCIEDIQSHLGCSRSRLKHCLARLRGNRFDYDRKLKRVPTSFYLDIDTVCKKDVITTGRGSCDYVIKDIVKDLAYRRPYLPKARDWAKDLGIEIRKDK